MLERSNPYLWYEVMRQTSPVHYDARRDRWDVFRYDDALRVLQDHETFSSDVSARYDDKYSGALGSSIVPELIQSVVVHGPKRLQLRFRGLPA